MFCRSFFFVYFIAGVFFLERSVLMFCLSLPFIVDMSLGQDGFVLNFFLLVCLFFLYYLSFSLFLCFIFSPLIPLFIPLCSSHFLYPPNSFLFCHEIDFIVDIYTLRFLFSFHLFSPFQVNGKKIGPLYVGYFFF